MASGVSLGTPGVGAADLELILGYRFKDRALLELALTHPSITHDLGAGTPHNQRLEFLGDAVLQLVLTFELFEKFPTLGEGPLTQARAEMVNRRTLATQSRGLGAGRFLRMSRSEESTGGRDRASALADAFEALVGAIFLDGGLEPARAFVLRRFRESFGQLQALPSLHNPKGELQELLQAESAEAPVYQLLSVNGPDHDREFECAVTYRGDLLARGIGKTKKAAESEAARHALERLKLAGDGGTSGLPTALGGATSG
ncbi:MAG: ribonuclease III [Verrucomicrobiales bacterium]|nr:ribonuclease III [Verrucomicrobiales bacterium]